MIGGVIELKWASDTAGSSGDNTALAAPGAGVVRRVRQLHLVQGDVDETTTVVVSAGTTELFTVILSNYNPLTVLTFPDGGITLVGTQALVLNLSAAQDVIWSAAYYDQEN